ncbi:hypothetical protein CRG98_014680 [Punica granatum]|uniref:Uncharacterized protein n=1 Tax=Punica granatum TaxID=22663 RepID=A0A2I0K8Q7_PUNGR|nr:hypothetical protein CRG98_014680 [Punica granatum]
MPNPAVTSEDCHLLYSVSAHLATILRLQGSSGQGPDPAEGSPPALNPPSKVARVRPPHRRVRGLVGESPSRFRTPSPLPLFSNRKTGEEERGPRPGWGLPRRPQPLWRGGPSPATSPKGSTASGGAPRWVGGRGEERHGAPPRALNPSGKTATSHSRVGGGAPNRKNVEGQAAVFDEVPISVDWRKAGAVMKENCGM